MMSIKRVTNVVNIVMFFGVIAALCVATVLLPKEDFSELENRYLVEMPSISVHSWFSGDYCFTLGEYSSEHFALRTRWISLRTRLERIMGHDEVNDVYFGDGMLFAAIEPFNYDLLDRSVESINTFADSVDAKVSLLIAPTSSQIYADKLPDNSPNPEQRRMINYVYSNVSDKVQTVDVYDYLLRARDDYIYYRTDHHWTTYGAYLAYTACIRRLGYSPVTLDRIDIEHASHSFYGSYHSKVLNESVEPDTVDIYTSGVANLTGFKKIDSSGSEVEYDSLYFREYLSRKDKYLTFLGPNVPLIEITSDAGGGSILVIKDSYANCFVPFLTKHFSKITVVDLRYMMRLSDYTDPSGFDNILILYNAETFGEDINIGKLSLEIGK